ncbi:hypothetical protein GGR52DRAFT_103477 [Hypoxylon sp. FL1284]|nr:hypothetical protein GGR52DRAFT_103477 [Hypoxylon sp. FL1284]
MKHTRPSRLVVTSSPTTMAPESYRHRCIACGRSRSKAFHRQYPTGPGYPVVKGVCGACRPPSPPSSPPSSRNNKDMHVHHHHWLHLPDEPESVYLQNICGRKSPLRQCLGPDEQTLTLRPGTPSYRPIRTMFLGHVWPSWPILLKCPPASFLGVRGGCTSSRRLRWARSRD